MTKAELTKALEPFSDEVEIFRPAYDGDGERNGETPITELAYSYINGVGQIVLG